jgi:hypothetical protein
MTRTADGTTENGGGFSNQPAGAVAIVTDVVAPAADTNGAKSNEQHKTTFAT